MRGLELGIDKSRTVDISSSVAQKTKLILIGLWNLVVVTLIELDNILLFALEKWESLIHCPRGFELSIDISSTVSQVPYVHQRQLIYRISLVFWATELDTSLSSSICQPALICWYRARGLSPFRGEKVEMVIELGDLSSSVTYRARFCKRRKKEKKWKLKQ